MDRSRNILIISVVGLAFIIFVSIWGASNIEKAPAFTLVLYAGLIVVTMLYAYCTMEIAGATRKQAAASVKMAEEMQKSRYVESLPLLIPTITPTWNTQGFDLNEIPYLYLQTGVGIKVMWRNLGNSVAINSRFSLLTAPLASSPGKALFLPPLESESLGVGEQKEVNFHDKWQGKEMDIPEKYHPRLEAEYHDIYERKITTVQEFRIEEQKEKAFLGELYFTIDGKRLGAEVEHN